MRTHGTNAIASFLVIFREKRSKFRLIMQKLGVFGFFIIHSIIPSISVIFSIIAIILVELCSKKYKDKLTLDAKFPYKSEKCANFNGPYLGNRQLFCDAVCGVRTASKSTFV